MCFMNRSEFTKVVCQPALSVMGNHNLSETGEDFCAEYVLFIYY